MGTYDDAAKTCDHFLRHVAKAKPQIQYFLTSHSIIDYVESDERETSEQIKYGWTEAMRSSVLDSAKAIVANSHWKELVLSALDSERRHAVPRWQHGSPLSRHRHLRQTLEEACRETFGQRSMVLCDAASERRENRSSHRACRKQRFRLKRLRQGLLTSSVLGRSTTAIAAWTSSCKTSDHMPVTVGRSLMQGCAVLLFETEIWQSTRSKAGARMRFHRQRQLLALEKAVSIEPDSDIKERLQSLLQ